VNKQDRAPRNAYPAGQEGTPPDDLPPLVSVASQIGTHLERMIFDGRLPSGSRLSEPEIASWFRTSRTPVRDALRRLEQAGLVVIEPRRGARVKMPSRSEIEDLLMVREALEGMAARSAAERATSEDLAALRDCIRRRKRERGLVPVSQVDFHETLMRAAHNHSLASLMIGSLNVFRMLRSISAGAGDRASVSATEHQAIVDAIVHRDPEQAEAAARAHVRAVRANLLPLLERVGGPEGRGPELEKVIPLRAGGDRPQAGPSRTRSTKETRS
jgi:DNA-binding GntR family transcriptional regulator